MAQRVVRRVHGQPGDRRRHGTTTPGRTSPTRVASGGCRRSAAQHRLSPAAGRTTPRRPSRATASRTPRARASSSRSTPCSATRCSSLVPSTTSRRTGSATPPCTTCSRWEKGAGDLSSFTGDCTRARRAGHDRSDRAAGVVRTRPTTRPTARTPSTSRPRRRWASGRSRRCRCRDRDAVLRRTVPRSCWTPTRTGGRWSSRTRPPDRPEGAPARDRRHPAAGRDLEQRAQRVPQRRPGPGRRARPARGRHPGGGQRRRDLRRSCRGRRTRSPLSADPDAALRRDPCHGGGEGALRSRRLDPAAVRVPGCGELGAGPGRARLADGQDLPDGIDLDLDLRWRVLVRLAVLGEIDRPGCRRRSTPSRPRSPASSTRGRWPRCRTPRPRRGPAFTGEVDVPNYELEAAGLGMWRHGQTDDGRVRRPLLRRPPRHRREAQRLAPRRRRRSSR